MTTNKLILAGPIVRRVEPDLVCVWLALTEPCKVRLEAWLGSITAGSAPSPEFSGEAKSTIRVGKNLHIAFATIEAKAGVRFLPEKTYSYNLTFTELLAPGLSATESLASLNLLKDCTKTFKAPHPEDPSKTVDVTRQVHASLGYEAGRLPTFVLPPRELSDLRIIHGSCRRPQVEVPDAMVWIDDLIQESRDNPKNRPHQLFLTGDQIYADDVGNAVLPIIDKLGTSLLTEERVSTRWPHLDKKRPVTFESVSMMFPPRFRQVAMLKDARFTTSDGTNHLISLADFAAHYLLVWNAELWPDLLVDYDSYLAQARKALEGLLVKNRVTDETAKSLKSVVTPLEPPPANHPREDERYKEEWEVYDQRRLDWKRHVLTLEKFRDGLPKVRRALANIATYMIFDDHEITDDWFLSSVWRDRVLTSPLGRTIFRNGLVAYALFQGWGNDPRALDNKNSPHSKLRDQVENLIPKAFANAFIPDPTASEAIEKLLGLNGEPTEAIEKAKIARWHYSIGGPRHQVFVLDARMRRSYQSRRSGPGNVSREALTEQLPDKPLSPEIEVTLVVSSLTVLGPPVIDALLGPALFRSFDMGHAGAGATDIPVPGMDPDAIEAWPNDPEAFEALLARAAPFKRVVFLSGDVHFATSAAMTYFKKGADTPTRFAQFTSSGFKNKFKQLIVNLDHSLSFMQKVATEGIHMERLGWEKKASNLVRVGDMDTVRPALRGRLSTSPVLLPVDGWPDDAQSTESDWSWRMHIVQDDRPDAERPEKSRPAVLVAGQPNKDVSGNADGYAKVAARHAAQLDHFVFGRRLLFAANLGVVSFIKKPDPLETDLTKKDKPKLFAIHQLHTREEDVDPRSKVYMHHEVLMEPGSEQPPKIGKP